MNLQPLIYSAYLFLGVFAVAFGLHFFTKCSSETVRKCIHIGVSNWWIIYLTQFDSLGMSLILPVFFVIFNTIMVYVGAGKILGWNDRRRNLGLIYYPVVLTVFVILNHYGILSDCSTLAAVLVMGYGDGLAALLGRKLGTVKIRGDKTIFGTMTMFLVSNLVILIAHFIYHPDMNIIFSVVLSVVIAAVATLLELYTPKGLDNISVPVSVALLVQLVQLFR